MLRLLSIRLPQGDLLPVIQWPGSVILHSNSLCDSILCMEPGTFLHFITGMHFLPFRYNSASFVRSYAIVAHRLDDLCVLRFAKHSVHSFKSGVHIVSSFLLSCIYSNANTFRLASCHPATRDRRRPSLDATILPAPASSRSTVSLR